jgi:hypothetical protein
MGVPSAAALVCWALGVGFGGGEADLSASVEMTDGCGVAIIGRVWECRPRMNRRSFDFAPVGRFAQDDTFCGASSGGGEADLSTSRCALRSRRQASVVLAIVGSLCGGWYLIILQKMRWGSSASLRSARNDTFFAGARFRGGEADLSATALRAFGRDDRRFVVRTLICGANHDRSGLSPFTSGWTTRKWRQRAGMLLS